jgi:uncharacterized coiled-coil protein SlyX
VRKPTRPEIAAFGDRVSTLWHGGDGENGERGAEQDRRLERRLEAVETRLDHLEAALEGLQDALYRQSQREDETVEELRRRTDPERMARDLSKDARRRGL